MPPKSHESPPRPGDLPHLSARQEKLVHIVAVASLMFGAYWIWWRWTYTLNPDAMVFSLLLVSAETWGLISSALFLFNAWHMPRREPPAPRPGISVDVFITVFDEPVEVVRRTAVGARAIRYPHRTYLLDDGKREEMQELAEDLEIGYIRRAGNASAKAGNLNHALGVTQGDFVLQLDADHVPLPNIIHRMIGYFDDPRVAFVQSPQDFYNTDSFTHVVNEQAHSLWEENRIFYSLLQPGKDNWNASFFCGSCGMLRRSALEGIGGFSTQTIIEDMETSLLLHGRGWKSVYHGEALAFGLSPASAGAFHIQRLRWAQGSMQILRKMNPLFLPGLTPAQRVCYLAAILYPLDGLQKAIFYFTPVIFLFTGLVPIRADTAELLLRLLPYLLLTITAFELLARGTGYILISERYNMAKFVTYIVALTGFFARKPLKFHVTPKGTSDVPLHTYLPQLTVLILSLAAVVWAPIAYGTGWVRYPVATFDIALWVSALWIVWNVYFAGYVVRLSLRAKQQRADHRFEDRFPVRVRSLLEGEDARGGAQPGILAMVQDLNPLGVAFRSTERLANGTAVEITLPLSTHAVTARGKILRVETGETEHGTLYVHGVQFDALPIEDRDAIEMHCTHHAVPIWRQRYRQSLDLFARASEAMRDHRGVRRHRVQLPARISAERDDDDTSSDGGGLLEDISIEGARLLLEHPLAPGTRVQFDVPGTRLQGQGVVVVSRALDTPMSVRFSVGVRLDGHGRGRPRRWRALAAPASPEGQPERVAAAPGDAAQRSSDSA